MYLIVFFLLVVCSSHVHSFHRSYPRFTKSNKLNATFKTDSELIKSWKSVRQVANAAAAIVLATSFMSPALADADSKELKKQFETCYSICMFEGKI